MCGAGAVLMLSSAQRMATIDSKNGRDFEIGAPQWRQCPLLKKIAEDRHEIKRRDGLAAMETAGAIDLREVFLATLGEAGDETSQAGAEDEKEEGSHWITSERVVI